MRPRGLILRITTLTVMLSSASLSLAQTTQSTTATSSPDPATSSPTATADAQFQAKQYDLAISSYQRIESSSTDPGIKAYAHSQIAECYGKKGDHTQARKILMEVVDVYRNQTRAVAKALLRAGDHALAGADLAGSTVPYERLVHDFNSTNDSGLREMVAQAAVHVARVRVRQANDAMIPLAGSPNSPALADAMAKVNAARAAWQRVATGFPDHPLWAAEAQLNLLELRQQDVLYGRGGDYAQIIEGADAFLQKFPSNGRHGATARLIKAEAQYFAGQYDAALQTIATIDPTVASPAAVGTAQRLLAQCYDGKGDYARALTEFQKFLDRKMPSFIPNVDRPVAQYCIGMCLKALGRNDEAVQALVKLKQDYPKSALGQAADTAVVELLSK